MGYISYVSDMNLIMGELKKPVPLEDWTELAGDDNFDYISYFIEVEAKTDFQKAVGGGEVEYVTALDFNYGDSGKAYEFDTHVSEFFRNINELLMEPVSGDFILQGEDTGDVKKYTVNDDGSVSVSEGLIIFPAINEILT